MRPTFGCLRSIVAVAIAFYAFGRLGQLVAIPPGNVTFLWLPAGIALAALYAGGASLWPGVWLGSLALNVGVLAGSGLVPAVLIGAAIASGATLQALLGAWWLRRFGGIFNDVRSVLLFGGPLAFGTCLLNATVGIAVLSAAGLTPWSAYGWTWLTWWLGDVTGVLVATPFLLAWWGGRVDARYVGSLLLRFLPLGLVLVLVFFNPRALPLAFLPLPFVLWLSLSHGLRGAVSTTVLVFAFALTGALMGQGPFAGRGIQEALMLFAVYVVVLSLTALVLAVVEERRKQAERGLKESLATIETILQEIPDMVVILDRTGRLVRWNRKFAETSAYPDAEIENRQALSFFREADRPRVAAAIVEVYDAGYATLQAALQRRDGSLLPIDYSAAPLRDARGEVIGLIGVARDFREHKRMEDRLRESEHRFRTVAMRVPVGIFMTDAGGACVFVNERWCFLTGISEAQALGAGWRDALHPLDRARVLAEWAAAVAAGAEFSSEYRFLRPDGSFVWVYGNATPLDPEAKEPVGYIGTLTDLTERIEAERLKLSFVNAVSHDLRTPLSTIKGFAEFLEDGLAGALNPAQGEYLAQIQRGTRRLEQLVDDLLDFATIEAGAFRLNLAPVDFGALLQEVASSLRPQAEEGQLVLDLEVVPASLLVPMDCRRIERVVLNLLQNAIKFSPRGAHITLRASVDGDRLRCEVIDRGRGIPANDLPKLFRPFGQLEAGNVKGGAGLGLSIGKAIVEAHRGAIGVLSKVGEGSTFWFTLPLSADQAPAAPPLAASVK
ncbi:MAG TPA: PAS domain S-box protein [Pantanalinema sp.]